MSQANEVRWEPAHELTSCSECRDFIFVGQPMATWDDVSPAWLRPAVHTKRRYCEDCGKLLEDSLSTTETICPDQLVPARSLTA